MDNQKHLPGLDLRGHPTRMQQKDEHQRVMRRLAHLIPMLPQTEARPQHGTLPLGHQILTPQKGDGPLRGTLLLVRRIHMPVVLLQHQAVGVEVPRRNRPAVRGATAALAQEAGEVEVHRHLGTRVM